jgi:mRNA interferase MazF
MARRVTALTKTVRVQRGQLWEVDFEPQTHKAASSKPGKRGRPALVIQTNILNAVGHATTIVIPGTTQVYRDAQGDGYPLRMSLGKVGKLKEETDLLIDQIRTISNKRLMGDKPLVELGRVHIKRVEDALRILMGE